MKNKFFAKKTYIGDIKFDSKKEANFYLELNMLRKAVEPNARVEQITRQPQFDIQINGKHIAYYRADFKVIYADGNMKIFDVKGYKKGCAYNLFRLKKKLVEAIYNIEIIEV
ncbi:MAG: DUF1064 domain-containing protein [Candidatus Lokiarchaeota archaeon]|nr:DUF1064 domain-containing protein [Candidatus Lokiarchaeota archaeon]